MGFGGWRAATVGRVVIQVTAVTLAPGDPCCKSELTNSSTEDLDPPAIQLEGGFKEKVPICPPAVHGQLALAIPRPGSRGGTHAVRLVPRTC